MLAPEFGSILRTLRAYEVDFIVVGGIGAVLQGAPVMTFDLDVVHSTEEANIIRLLGALRELDAIYRVKPESRLTPQPSHLGGPDHQLLITRYGPLDVLGAIGNGRTYADLLPHTILFDVDHGISVRVLSLEQLITVKEEVGAEKDRIALPTLRRTLAERNKG